MPNVLIVAATKTEIGGLIHHYEVPVSAENGMFQSQKQTDLWVLLTGAGMVNTAFELGKLIGSRFDVVINAGIAGSFNRYQIGDVVNVTQDCFSELGAEDGDGFLNMDELGLGRQNVEPLYPFENHVSSRLPVTNAITVNTVHGNEKSITSIVEKYQPHIESMEGAAFFHAANSFNWKCIQLRAVSNLVTRRNRSEWNIDLAVKNLNTLLIELVNSLIINTAQE